MPRPPPPFLLLLPLSFSLSLGRSRLRLPSASSFLVGCCVGVTGGTSAMIISSFLLMAQSRPPPYCVVVYFWRWFSRRSHRIVIVVRTCAPPPLPEVQCDGWVRNSPPQLNAPVRRCPRRSWLCLRRRCRVSMARPLREAGLMGAMPREAGSLGGREGGE